MDSVLLGFIDAFGSASELVTFALVVGGALLFVGYLLADGYYHRRKWRRIRRKFKEAAAAHNDDEETS